MVTSSTTLPVSDQLDHYYQQVMRVILSRQDPLSGLFPASTAISNHGDYTDAWVRDNVYAIQSVWALGIAYRKSGADNGRSHLLEQSVVKTMRGLLLAMMRQSDKVERFKRSRNPYDALHAKYDVNSGDTIVSDYGWGHLQLDATAVFVLMLSQIIKSGLRLIYTTDEVNFVQNLTYYLGRAYRTPDFGIWERGNKRNDGRAEINASSLGMVKAALEAVRTLNLFGSDLSQDSVVHVVSDEIAQARITLENLLPRESVSKEVDAALLSVTGYPAFAVEDEELVLRTEQHILSKLGGEYGCKRFLLDGHQTVLEDNNRLYYEETELGKFNNIESEWPLFFTYLFLACLFREDYVGAAKYRKKLQALCVEKDGLRLLPELYYVPSESIKKEKKNPGTQRRTANENIPLIWAQSLYYLGCMVDDGLVSIEDIDPLRRHSRLGNKKRVQLQIALLADDLETQLQLNELGFENETMEQLTGITVKEGRELSRVFNYIGVNEKLRLSGRPMRRMRAMMSSQVYRLRGELVVFIPQFQNQADFYLNLDNHILVDQIITELNYLKHHWDQTGKPLMTLAVNKRMLDAIDGNAFIDFLYKVKNDRLDGLSVALGLVSEQVHLAGRETIKELHNFEFLNYSGGIQNKNGSYLVYNSKSLKPLELTNKQHERQLADDRLIVELLSSSENIYQHIDSLQILQTRYGSDFEVAISNGKRPVLIRKLVEEVYAKACELRLWSVIRLAAGLLDKYYDRLDVAVQEMIIRQKQVMVGRSHNPSATINETQSCRDIFNQIKESCENDVRETQLNQEVLALLGGLVKAKPELFDGILTIRTGHLLLLCISEYAEENNIKEDESFEAFANLSPYCVKQRLEALLSHYQKATVRFNGIQTLQYVKSNSDLVFINFTEQDNPKIPDKLTDWQEWRRQSGTIVGLPGTFYQKLWLLLGRCKGIVIGDRYNWRSRLDTDYIFGAMTKGERSFALLVDGALNEIHSPEYRYLIIEAIMAISLFVEVNPDLKFDDYLMLDSIIERALRRDWLNRNPGQEKNFDDDNSVAWEKFYQNPPHIVAEAINGSLEQLLRGDHSVPAVQKVTAEPGQSLGL